MHVQLALVKGSRRQRFVIRKARTVIGRRKGCDLRIPLSEISRRHCRLRIDGDDVTLEDLDSVNGTFLNEDRVRGEIAVRSGDQIRLGPIIFVAEFDHLNQLPKAKPITDDEIEEDVEVVDDGLPAAARPVVDIEREDVAQPIPMESGESLAPIDDQPTQPPPKKRKTASKPAVEQVPLPEAAGEEFPPEWVMPASSDFNLMLDELAENAKKAGKPGRRKSGGKEKDKE
jgi:pSer/pThr/pTyr-binding forkhead associated (FHA) protein